MTSKKQERLTLHGNDVATLALDHLGDHVVNQTVLIPDLLRLELLLVLLVVDLLEDVLEAAIVLLQDSVLGAHVERQTLEEGQLEGSVSKSTDGLISVVLDLGNTRALEVIDLNALGLAARRSEDQLQLTGTRDQAVGGTVLITESVTTDDDGLRPARDETGNTGNDNGLTEDGSTAIRL